jgi:hypothetical protein
LSPLLFALLALDMGSAARDLARTAASALAHEAVILSVRNLSTLSVRETAEIRRTFESELRAAGLHTTEVPPAAEVRLTISENLTHFLLAAEIRTGGAQKTLLGSWPRVSLPSPPGPAGAASLVTLDKKLLWEQAQPVLDVAQFDGATLILDPFQILLVRGAERESVPLPAGRSWPRDVRGRLLVNGSLFTAWLPGTLCRGGFQPRLSVECQESQEAWPLWQGASAVFAPGRNYFEGRVEMESLGARDIPAFYSAAAAGNGWVFAGIDGRAHFYTRSWEEGGSIDQWGGDLAGVQTPCGARILATRPTGAAEPDAIQPYELAGGGANPAGPALDFSGPVTALWSTGNSAVAVSRVLQTGRYEAFSLVPACGS